MQKQPKTSRTTLEYYDKEGRLVTIKKRDMNARRVWRTGEVPAIPYDRLASIASTAGQVVGVGVAMVVVAAGQALLFLFQLSFFFLLAVIVEIGHALKNMHTMVQEHDDRGGGEYYFSEERPNRRKDNVTIINNITINNP